MNDDLLKEAAVECGDEFLNGEAEPAYAVPHDSEDFIAGEANRFAGYLRSYINERISQGDFLTKCRNCGEDTLFSTLDDSELCLVCVEEANKE